MSILGRFLASGGGVEQRTLMGSNFVPPPSVGVIDDFVGVHRAMANMTVFACVRLLADTIASLPWKAYRRDSKGVPKEVKPQPTLITQPFPGFDLFEWKWMVVASMALRGNSYHYVTSRDKQGNPTALLPLHPDIVFLERRPDVLMWFDPVYRIMGEAVPRQDLIHMRRFTMPGEPWGLSPIRQAAVAIGLGLSAEEYGYRFYKESATPSGTLTTDQDVDEETLRMLQQNWIQSHGGRRLPAVLSKGFKFEAISIRPDEAQFLECVVAGTAISMADGTRKSVENLSVGEQVLAWNGSKLVAAPVKAVGSPPVKQMVKITTARGRVLTCTEDHPVLGLKRLRTAGGRPLSTDGEWIPAGTLEPGQYVRAALGSIPTVSTDLSEDVEYDAVKSVEHLGPGQTIGVEIADLHTFVTNGIITHNTRQFQRSEICLLFGVPPILVGDTKETTAWGTGVEQITLGAVTYTFRPWTSLIESALSACLPRGQFVRFDYNALLRGDMAGRYTALKTAIDGTFMTPNEARASEEMDPVPNGDDLLVPPNFVSLGFQNRVSAAGDAAGPVPAKGPAKKTPAKAPATPGKAYPMPPTGGGERGVGNGNGHDENDMLATCEKELRLAYDDHGKPDAMLNGEE